MKIFAVFAITILASAAQDVGQFTRSRDEHIIG